MMAGAEPIVVLDVETRHLAQEVGGWGNLHKLRVSVAVTYNTETNVYQTYLEDQMDQLFEELQTAGRVVGYNLLRFDYPVLQPYAPFQLRDLPTVDMLDHLHRTLGFRVSLDSVAGATLGVGKSADGIMAVRWFRQGDVQRVADYCRQDVEVTHGVYEFGRQKGFVRYQDRNYGIRQVYVRW